MFDTNQSLNGIAGGLLRRRRKTLLAGVVGLALVVTAAGNFVVPARSQAATVPPAGQTFQAPPSFADVIQQVTPAVVSVKVRSKEMPQNLVFNDGANNGQQQFDLPFGQFFRQFRNFGQQNVIPQPNAVVRAEGSGFFVTDDGYIITNNHVVDNATQVDVVTGDGRTLSAKIVGKDPQTDLALLKVDGKDFPYVRFAVQPPRVGDWVIAMGNPFGLGDTATAGIVSANGRDIGAGPYDNFMQIDAPVNRGNSGGPTFNAKGEVVGVNTAIYSPSGGSVGIGFAIPADTVQSVFTALKDKGSVTRGAIGVQIQPVTQGIAEALGMTDMHGALVDQAQPDRPAAKAGLASGDVITSVDGKAVLDARDLARRISMLQPGTKVTLTYVRKGETKSVDLTLDTLPGTKTAQPDMGSSGSNALPHLGMTLAPSGDMTHAASSGVVVTEVDPSGVASERGIKRGDVILDVNGQKVSTPQQVLEDLHTVRSEHKTMALMRIQSGDQTRFVAVPVA
ncbi:MAG: Do family serine endopeptidase [Methylobacteriaceae bacterium]|nr:Do family serine endopeptidase [Methylobacteriaceae bacterium]